MMLDLFFLYVMWLCMVLHGWSRTNAAHALSIVCEGAGLRSLKGPS